jgi:ribosomal protein S18 acetylase RimI-like enzyme
MTPSSGKPRRLEIRSMTIDDFPKVWHIGERIFSSRISPYTYRTWTIDELVTFYHNDPELCLVAENIDTGRIVGFILGTILKRPYSPWTYGYVVWAGVRRSYQKRGVGVRLYKELEKRFVDKGVRIAIADAESTNKSGIKFLESLGFKQAETYFWFSKSLEKE